jgi:hypothetical protein
MPHAVEIAPFSLNAEDMSAGRDRRTNSTHAFGVAAERNISFLVA